MFLCASHIQKWNIKYDSKIVYKIDIIIITYSTFIKNAVV